MIKEKFLSLEKREQHAVILCGAFVLLFVLYQFIYAPFADSLAKTKKQIGYQQQLLAWMVEVKAKWNPHASKKSLDSAKLLSRTTESLKQNTLSSYSYQLKQVEGSNVNLSFDKVPYVKLIAWMRKYWSSYPLNLKRLSLQPLGSPGLVKANVDFGVDKG